MTFERLCSFGGRYLYGLENCRFLTSDTDAESLSLKESWGYKGIYAFVREGCEDAAFAGELLRYCRRAGEGLVFLWLGDGGFRDAHGIFSLPGNRGVMRTWGLNFSGYGAVISQGAGLSAGDGGFAVTGVAGFQGGYATLWGRDAEISLSGEIAFRVRHKGDRDLAESLDSGVKLTFDYAFEREAQARANGFLLTAINRVLRAAEPMELRVELNPSLNELRVYLPENHVFDSSFIGVSGRKIRLKALPGAHWTLAETATHRHNTDYLHTRYYLTLSGCFQFLFDADKTILPGLSGTEYFDLSGTDTPIITFVPDRAAYFGVLNGRSPKPTTAWIRYPKNTAYYSQPSDAPLFAPADGEGLSFFPLPLLTMDGGVSVPQLFYRELDGIPGADLEKGVYACRFQTLSEAITAKTDANAPERRAVSPQGLMVGARAAAWDWVSLANVGTAEAEELLLLKNIDLPLRKAFADVNMNLVFENPGQLTPYVSSGSPFAFRLDELWDFDMNPVWWNNLSLFVIKYGTDSTVREMAEGNKAFQLALESTVSPDGKPAEEFAAFLAAVDDPKFTGILALGVKLDVDASKLNDSLKTVWTGIPEADRAAIRAHHLIIRHSRLTLEGGLTQREAFVDALIYYRGESLSYSDSYNAPDYAFQTTALTLECKNSRLQSLVTESELLINAAAGSRCKKEGGNSLILDGRADSTSGLDGFSFSLRQTGLYVMDSPLEGIAVNRVSLSGESLFSLDGKFYFRNYPESDLFSFGFDGDTDCGLRFMGWKIRKGSDGTYAAEYGDILPTQSGPRANSWADRFPVGVDMFCHDDSRTPEQCGYVNVKTTMPQRKIGLPWYGIRFRVPLGSLGDLSENSMLDLSILIAWSGGDSPGMYVGVRLPATLGGGGLDVQGLVKLGFDTVALESREVDGHVRFRLSLKQFTARLLWASFPPGKNEIVIEADNSGKKLGWLGYYKEDAAHDDQ